MASHMSVRGQGQHRGRPGLNYEPGYDTVFSGGHILASWPKQRFKPLVLLGNAGWQGIANVAV